MRGYGPVLQTILRQVKSQKGCHWVLLDPDDFSMEHGAGIASTAEKAGVDALLIGGSLLHTNHFDSFVGAVKQAVSIPIILFPGDATQLSGNADAVLFLSLVSGRNPVNLIGEQVKGAPVIKKLGIEPVSTAYMLVESGAVTSVEFMSGTRPIPRAKPMIAAAHALAAQYMGMSLVYLEAGSGAPNTVPPEMIRMVREYVDIPIICGGGIRDAATAKEKIDAGADIIVTGNLLKADSGVSAMVEIATAVKNG
ncbi:MAG: geranylgeranylglyceryl/heptaprenylglyceryl phosphate synthase [Chitinivibrionales bacterium]|nr:geranylgeranylglyceryl/heptaprenylglyceryl phosphate synthase [Chitinivibrionales bacterium]MBD3394660.1 geranylgeranylglyceryl/heptaprenylglyceryl phosphate synthase [Chitinivibrionales bacterium]